MKKNLLLCSLIFLLLKSATAQQQKNEFKRFGIFAGVNSSHINFAKGVPPPAVPIPTSRRTGIRAGFLVTMHITGNLYFQPEYAYAQMGGKVIDSSISYTLNYFSMPLFLKYRLSEQFAFFAGPQFDLLVKAKKMVSGNSADITHDTEERSFGATGGIEYEVIPALFVNARYMYGLNHIGLGQRSDIREFKYEMLQLTAGFRF